MARIQPDAWIAPWWWIALAAAPKNADNPSLITVAVEDEGRTLVATDRVRMHVIDKSEFPACDLPNGRYEPTLREPVLTDFPTWRSVFPHGRAAFRQMQLNDELMAVLKAAKAIQAKSDSARVLMEHEGLFYEFNPVYLLDILAGATPSQRHVSWAIHGSKGVGQLVVELGDHRRASVMCIAPSEGRPAPRYVFDITAIPDQVEEE